MSDRRSYHREGTRQPGDNSRDSYRNGQSSGYSRNESDTNWDRNSREVDRHSDSHRPHQSGNGGAPSTVVRASYNAVAVLSARGDAKVKEIEQQTGARVKVMHDDDNWTDIGVRISGSQDQIRLAEQMIQELSTKSPSPVPPSNAGSQLNASSGMNPNDWAPVPHGMVSTSSSSSWQPERRSQPFEATKRQGNSFDSREKRSSQPSGDTLIIKVPSSCVGRIIGRGGSKINELQDQSGARIKINKDDDNGVEASIQITGDAAKQKEAERLIKDLLEDTNSYSGARNNSNFSSQSSNFGSSNNTSSATDAVEFVDWANVIKESKEATIRRWANAPQIAKNFYIEDPEVSVMPREQIEHFRKTHNNIAISHYKQDDDRPLPNPVTSFAQAFAHYPEILSAVQGQQFKDPSPIQCQAWPVLLKGHDLIGIAQTGTGKTLAFLLPALVHIEGQPIPRSQRDGPSVLIMAPTRELAQQIEREVAKFPYKGIKCLCVFGGGDRRQQIGACEKGVEIVVATPGRLYDLMQAKVLKTSSVSYVVLDEADRMLDLGFEPQIKKILIDVRPDRQIIMTSATWPEGIRRIANEYMDNPLQVCVGTLDLAAVHSVTQHVEILNEEDKRQRLLDFIKHLDPTDKAIVFVGRKLVADQVASELSLIGIVCQCIHGDREQADREQALEDLRNGEVRLLIATDVASRGIDIKDITHILNYDFPRHAEEYVHRVGRTGRAGRTGIAISFMTREDWSKAQDLIDILKEANQEIPEELIKMAERFAAWKERKEEERARNATDMGGGGGGFRGRGGRGGGRRGDRDGFGGGFGGGGGGGRRGGGFGRDFF